MVGALALALLARGTPVQATPEAVRALSAFRQMVVVAPSGGKKPSDAALIEAAPLAKSAGTYRLKARYTLLVQEGAVATLVSDDVASFKEIVELPGVLRTVKRLPEGRVAALGAFPPAMVDYVRAAVSRRLPYHNVPEGAALGRTNYVLQPQNRLTLESNGQKVTLTLTDGALARMTRDERRKMYEPADATAIPLALPVDKIAAKVKEQAASPTFLGEGMAFHVLRKRDPLLTTEEAIQESLDAYRKAVREAREEAARAAASLQAELRKRFPEMVAPYPEGKAVSALPDEVREGLRIMLETRKSLGQGPSDVDAFLTSARIGESALGLTLGVAFQPDNSILGITIWPR